MPYSVNGIGTGLIAASKQRAVGGGHLQFDAIEALQVLFCPLVPYKVLHVLSYVEAGVERHSYRSVPLRFSARLIAKAFLRGWNNVLLFAGGILTPLLAVVLATMSRPVTREDYLFLAVFVAALLVGGLLRLIWWHLSRTDERIKDIIGLHELGTADPLYWPAEIAEAARAAILKQESLSHLTDVGRRAAASGDLAKAMFCARLAMQDRRDLEAQELVRQLLGRYSQPAAATRGLRPDA